MESILFFFDRIDVIFFAFGQEPFRPKADLSRWSCRPPSLFSCNYHLFCAKQTFQPDL